MVAGKSSGVVVLGGGLTGLAAGMHSGSPVYEASQQVGGVATSITEDGFTFDLGIHVLQTRNQRILDLLADLGVSLGVRERNAYIYSHGCYTAYPFQVNTAKLPIALRARCVWGFFQRGREPEPSNYEQWMYANLGRGFADTFLVPYSDKFWTVSPREMTHDWTGNRVPTPSMAQVLRGALWDRQTKIGTNAVFRYPDGGAGYGTIATALARRVPEIHLGHTAVAVDTRRRRVTFAGGQMVDYRVLVSSIPVTTLIEIASGVPDEVRTAASKLRTNSIFLVNLGIDRPDISDYHWVHFPEPDISFFRLSYPHNFDPEVVPPGKSSISVEVAYSPLRPIDKERVTDRVIGDLRRTGILRKQDRILLTNTSDIPRAYCIYDHARKDAVRVIAKWLRANDIITCGRYGLWTYFWSDESINSGINAAENALKLASARVEVSA